MTPYRGTAPTLEVVQRRTIGELARQAGVHVETIRYYERRGLLPEPPRTDSGYRQYGGDDLWRLQFIARAKSLGFTLAEIATLLDPGQAGRRPPAADTAASGDGAGVESVRALARSKLEDLARRQEELTATRQRLERLLEVCADADSDDCRALRLAD